MNIVCLDMEGVLVPDLILSAVFVIRLQLMKTSKT